MKRSRTGATAHTAWKPPVPCGASLGGALSSASSVSSYSPTTASPSPLSSSFAVKSIFERAPPPPPPPQCFSPREGTVDADMESADAGEGGAVDRPFTVSLSALPGVHFHLHREIHSVRPGIFCCMRRREQQWHPDAAYLTETWQPCLNARMRGILFDWMMEVGQEYALKRETMHYAMNIVDMFLSKVREWTGSSGVVAGCPQRKLGCVWSSCACVCVCVRVYVCVCVCGDGHATEASPYHRCLPPVPRTG